jgi:muramidase (phage lysozyme)
MDPTVPRGAAELLDFIRQTEVGRQDRASYDVIYGFNQKHLAKPVTTMTVDEVIAAQAGWTKRFGSSATGGYQFMRATLTDLKRELGLSGSQVLDPNLQDRLGYHLLKRRGYEQFVAGLINRTEFGKRLAMEWASFPVLAATKGAHRSLSRGQSYYSGDRLNKALVPAERVEAVLDQVLVAARSPVAEAEYFPPVPAPVPVPIPRPELETIEARPDRPTPVEQSTKAVGAGKWAAIAGAIWTTIVAADVLPPQFTTPEFVAAVTALIAAVAGTIGAYRAPPNRG